MEAIYILIKSKYTDKTVWVLESWQTACAIERTEYLINGHPSSMRDGPWSSWEQSGRMMEPCRPAISIPFFGYKSHISIDRKFRLIRKWNTTNSARTCWIAAIRPLMSGQTRAYRAKNNEAFVGKHGFVSRVHRKKQHSNLCPGISSDPMRGKSVIRSRFKHVLPIRSHRQVSLFGQWA